MSSKGFPWSSIVVLAIACFAVGAVSGMLVAERDSVEWPMSIGIGLLGAVTIANLWSRTRRAAISFQTELAEDVEHFTRKQIEREQSIGHA